MKSCLLTLACISFALFSSARVIKPVFAINVLGTKSYNDITVSSGLFQLDSRKVNIGFSVTNDFELFNKVYLKTGIRYIVYSNTVAALNQLYTQNSKPDPIT